MGILLNSSWWKIVRRFGEVSSSFLFQNKVKRCCGEIENEFLIPYKFWMVFLQRKFWEPYKCKLILKIIFSLQVSFETSNKVERWEFLSAFNWLFDWSFIWVLWIFAMWSELHLSFKHSFHCVTNIQCIYILQLLPVGWTND